MTVLPLPCAEMYAYVHHASTKKCHLSDGLKLVFSSIPTSAYLSFHRSSRHQMTPVPWTRCLIAAPPLSAVLAGQVRFGNKSPLRSAVCSFYLGGAFKVHPGSSALPLTSYVLDPVSLATRITSAIPPARLKGGQLSIGWDGVSFRAAHAGPVISLGVRLEVETKKPLGLAPSETGSQSWDCNPTPYGAGARSNGSLLASHFQRGHFIWRKKSVSSVGLDSAFN